MCDACETELHMADAHRRRRLWEMTGGWHCSVLGTCLSLSDLRALGRKLPLKTRKDFPVDYQLHGYFVKEAGHAGTAARLLNKLLDKRHATAIRRARAMKSDQDLAGFWAEALAAGDIPGPYWAILSHPSASDALCERMFADVHMLSHLVGASNRADIRRLQTLDEDVADLKEKLAHEQARHRERLGQKEKVIGNLRDKLRQMAATPALPAPRRPEEDDLACVSIPALKGELTRLTEAEARAEAALKHRDARITELLALADSLRDENAALEQALLRERCTVEGACPMDLGGRCLLYVGGRQQTVPRLRALVEAWNGEFIYHDGGLEKSMGELAGAVVRADAVVFPTDCVSHDAANTVKRLCRHNMKPFLPLRSSGIASFVAGLRRGLDGIAPMGHAD